MSAFAGRTAWDRLARLRRQRRVQTALTLGLVVLGPSLAVATFFVMGVMGEGASSGLLRAVLLADLVYVLILAGLVLQRIMRMIAARRARSAGSALHFRLIRVFAFVALTPTVLVAVFATLTLNFGLEGWFSDRVRQVVTNSLEAAQAYQAEHREEVARDAATVARFLTEARAEAGFLTDSDLRQLLNLEGLRGQHNLARAFIVDGTGALRVRGERSYLFDFEAPSAEDLARARAGEVVVTEHRTRNEVRALMDIPVLPDRLLFVARAVDGAVLDLLDETRATVGLYLQLEQDRSRLLFEFALIYLGFALILILAAIWLGLWYAERLARPVGALAGAAERVGAGDLDVRVAEEEGEDEFATLGRVFNQMTRQLGGQREALLASNRATEARRRLFDSVLSSVTSGVMGLDAAGRVEFANPAARTALALPEEGLHERHLSEIVPEFAALLEGLAARGGEVMQQEMRLTRGGRLENLLVRLATRRRADGTAEGYVLAFDDVTELVSAQRLAAWGDVARRIAHEIKNPLTPIQLSAERLRRKLGPLLPEAEAEALAQYTEVIVRQTGDLRRIVDEFSRFARMPEPERRRADLLKALRDAVTLEQSRGAGVEVVLGAPEEVALIGEYDLSMLGQAFTNLLKNAGEATETLRETPPTPEYRSCVRVEVEPGDGSVTIRISDNGAGLPADRSRLFEPYVTTRARGTGLGLPIVKKIIEEHGGTLELTDAAPFPGATHCGAMAVVRLPLMEQARRDAATAVVA